MISFPLMKTHGVAKITEILTGEVTSCMWMIDLSKISPF